MNKRGVDGRGCVAQEIKIRMPSGLQVLHGDIMLDGVVQSTHVVVRINEDA